MWPNKRKGTKKISFFVNYTGPNGKLVKELVRQSAEAMAGRKIILGIATMAEIQRDGDAVLNADGFIFCTPVRLLVETHFTSFIEKVSLKCVQGDQRRSALLCPVGVDFLGEGSLARLRGISSLPPHMESRIRVVSTPVEAIDWVMQTDLQVK